jgi:hypothetical protein
MYDLRPKRNILYDLRLSRKKDMLISNEIKECQCY